MIVNDKQQDRIAIRVSDGGPKPDQLASMCEDEMKNKQYGRDLP